MALWFRFVRRLVWLLDHIDQALIGDPVEALVDEIWWSE